MRTRNFWTRRFAAAALIYALSIPPVALAQSGKQEKKPGRKGAIAVLASGLALVAVGAVGITQSSNGCHGQWVSDGSGWGIPCTPIPWLQRDGRKMGVIAIGVGSAFTAGGIVMLAKSGRPKADSPKSNVPAARFGSRAVPRWLYAPSGPSGPGSDCGLHLPRPGLFAELSGRRAGDVGR
jgi:hypothetical protein